MASDLGCTFSLILRDPETGWIGSAVASTNPAIGGSVPHAFPGAGVVHVQLQPSRDLANLVLKNLAMRIPIREALKQALMHDSSPQTRQVLVMDQRGSTVVETGAEAPGVRAQVSERDFVAAGYALASEDAVDSMIRSIELNADSPLLYRLIQALEMASYSCGDPKALRSAGARIFQPPAQMTSDAILDLRVDDHAEPIAELRRLYELVK